MNSKNSQIVKIKEMFTKTDDTYISTQASFIEKVDSNSLFLYWNQNDLESIQELLDAIDGEEVGNGILKVPKVNVDAITLIRLGLRPLCALSHSMIFEPIKNSIETSGGGYLSNPNNDSIIEIYPETSTSNPDLTIWKSIFTDSFTEQSLEYQSDSLFDIYEEYCFSHPMYNTKDEACETMNRINKLKQRRKTSNPYSSYNLNDIANLFTDNERSSLQPIALSN